MSAPPYRVRVKNKDGATLYAAEAASAAAALATLSRETAALQAQPDPRRQPFLLEAWHEPSQRAVAAFTLEGGAT